MGCNWGHIRTAVKLTTTNCKYKIVILISYWRNDIPQHSLDKIEASFLFLFLMIPTNLSNSSRSLDVFNFVKTSDVREAILSTAALAVTSIAVSWLTRVIRSSWRSSLANVVTSAETMHLLISAMWRRIVEHNSSESAATGVGDCAI